MHRNIRISRGYATSCACLMDTFMAYIGTSMACIFIYRYTCHIDDKLWREVETLFTMEQRFDIIATAGQYDLGHNLTGHNRVGHGHIGHNYICREATRLFSMEQRFDNIATAGHCVHMSIRMSIRMSA